MQICYLYFYFNQMCKNVNYPPYDFAIENLHTKKHLSAYVITISGLLYRVKFDLKTLNLTHVLIMIIKIR